jgi:hypothetical protein
MSAAAACSGGDSCGLLAIVCLSAARMRRSLIEPIANCTEQEVTGMQPAVLKSATLHAAGTDLMLSAGPQKV